MVSLQFDLESSWRLRVGVALPGRCCTPWQPRSRTEIDSQPLFTTTIRAEQQQRTTKPQKKETSQKNSARTELNLNRLVLKLLRRITPSRSHSPSPTPIPHRPHHRRCRRSPMDSWKGGWNFVVREMEKLKTLAFLISAFFVFVSLFVAFFTHTAPKSQIEAIRKRCSMFLFRYSLLWFACPGEMSQSNRRKGQA